VSSERSISKIGAAHVVRAHLLLYAGREVGNSCLLTIENIPEQQDAEPIPPLPKC
jgi:hypothetical protein